MDDTRHTLNELLVDLFNYILLIEEKNLRDQGVKLSMTEVHILEAVSYTHLAAYRYNPEKHQC